MSPCKRIYKGETRKCAKHNGELMDISRFLKGNPKIFVVHQYPNIEIMEGFIIRVFP
jgi:hypothetical protein